MTQEKLNYIMNLKDHFEKVYDGYKVIFLTQYGSHLYGFSNENSDVDVKGIFIPSVHDLVLGCAIDQWSNNTKGKNEKNTKDDIDFELFSVQRFLIELNKGITNALDINYAITNPECTLLMTDEWKYITDNSKAVLSNNLGAFFGYCVGQTVKYGIKGERLSELEKLIEYVGWFDKSSKIKDKREALNAFIEKEQTDYIKFNTILDVEYFYVLGRNYITNITITELQEKLVAMRSKYGNRAELAKDNDGVDLKALSHAFRILSESEELMLTGELKFPVNNAEFIREVRNGQMDKDILYTKLFEYLDQVKELEKSDKNVLKESKNKGHEYIINLYKNMGYNV
jgi:predicted nucleotidyltransferase